MKIYVTHLTLRFYEIDGWTRSDIHKLLVNKNHTIELRISKLFPDSNYYAVYENSGREVFTKELLNHTFENKNNYDINWYIKKE